MTTRQAGGIALVLLVVAAFLAAVFATIDIVEERARLSELRTQQDAPLREANALRHRVDVLASGLLALAAGGDAGARAVINEMHRQGISIEPHKP